MMQASKILLKNIKPHANCFNAWDTHTDIMKDWLARKMPGGGDSKRNT
jgi:hypothetical protein